MRPPVRGTATSAPKTRTASTHSRAQHAHEIGWVSNDDGIFEAMTVRDISRASGLSRVACADVADDHYHRKYAPRFADACSPDVLARPPEAASCLPLCRTLLEAASSPRKR